MALRFIPAFFRFPPRGRGAPRPDKNPMAEMLFLLKCAVAMAVALVVMQSVALWKMSVAIDALDESNAALRDLNVRAGRLIVRTDNLAVNGLADTTAGMRADLAALKAGQAKMIALLRASPKFGTPPDPKKSKP